MTQPVPAFRAPSALEALANRAFGLLVRLGLGLPHNYLLQVRGRSTGRVHATPVNVLAFEGGRFLVAGRGRTQWVRNAEAAGEVTLAKGRSRERFRVRALSDREKPKVLSAYLDRFRFTVHRYFPLPPGSPPEAFAPVAERYPVFELRPLTGQSTSVGSGPGARR